MLNKRIPTIIGLLIVTAVVVAWYLLASGTLKQNSENFTPNKVSITNVSDTRFSVSWTTKNPTYGYIEYGESGGKIVTKALDDRGGDRKFLTHHVTVVNLQPNSQYSFRIISGEPERRYDNNQKPYSVTTGPVITEIPVARSVYGEIEGGDDDLIIYLTLPGSYPASVVGKKKGNYNVNISTIRTEDLKRYASYDPNASIIQLTVDTGKLITNISTSTESINPVPKITIGKDADYRNTQNYEQNTVAEATTTPQQIEILNVEPLEVNQDNINLVENVPVSITNPAIDGEVLASLKPEFRGKGTPNIRLIITISGQKNISDSTVITSNGEWEWTPPIDLGIGKQKITVAYTDNNDKEQKIEKTFVISTATSSSVPAFVATSSASTKPSTSPRITLPATESGVPVTGIFEVTVGTMGIGLLLLILGGVGLLMI